MQVFKTSLKIIFKSPFYLLLYIVLFGFLGVILVSPSVDESPSQATQTTQATQEIAAPTIAIIDRDNSAVSGSIVDFLSLHADLIEVDDNTKALQDVTALNLASYILIIPESFGREFLETTRAGAKVPVLETVVNFAEADAILMDLLTNKYLSALHIAAVGAPEATGEEVLALASEAARQHIEIADVEVSESASVSTGVVHYFQFMAYPITTGLIVLTALIFASFQSGELRRRNLCAPLSPSAMNSQVALGCLSLVLMTWVFLLLVSMLPQIGGLEMISTNPLGFTLFALAALVYALVPFALGFLISQLGLRESAVNGFANIAGLSFCFISGVFMGGAVALGEGIQTLAHFVPTYWYSEALLALKDGGLEPSALAVYFGNLGIILLFALAFFSVALLVGRQRAQSTDAGGNPAADTAI